MEKLNVILNKVREDNHHEFMPNKYQIDNLHKIIHIDYIYSFNQYKNAYINENKKYSIVLFLDKNNNFAFERRN